MARVFSRFFLVLIFATGTLHADDKPDVSMTETYWKLLSLGTTQVAVPENQREPHMRLRAAKPEVDGFGGCNSFHGTFTMHEKKITFHNLQSTLTACSQLNTETAFFKTLADTTSYQIRGEFLTLFDAKNHRLAHFQAIYFM